MAERAVSPILGTDHQSGSGVPGLGSPRGPARDAARAADAREVRRGHPGPREGRRAELRAQVGRLSLPRLQGRRRGRAHQPQHQAADPLLPRGRGRRPRAAAGALRARRRALRRAAQRARRPARVRDPAGAHPSGEVARRHAGREDAGRVRRLRPAGAGRHVVRRPPVRRAPAGDGGGAGWPHRPLLPDPHHHRPVRGRGLVPPLRGRRARRRGRQAAGRDVPAERPHHAEDQARAHRRRRGRRLPRAQDLDARAAAARQPAARACTPTASCSTWASARASPRSVAPS